MDWAYYPLNIYHMVHWAEFIYSISHVIFEFGDLKVLWMYPLLHRNVYGRGAALGFLSNREWSSTVASSPIQAHTCATIINYVYLSIYLFTATHTYIYIHMCIYICICIYLYIYVYIYIYIYIYTYVYIQYIVCHHPVANWVAHRRIWKPDHGLVGYLYFQSFVRAAEDGTTWKYWATKRLKKHIDRNSQDVIDIPSDLGMIWAKIAVCPQKLPGCGTRYQREKRTQVITSGGTLQ